MKEKVLFILLALSIGLFFFDQWFISSKQITKKSSLLETEVGIHVGEKAADFQLETREGTEIALSDFKGNYVFINFWASWCPPCRAEMPHIQEVYNEYKNKDFVILSVNLTHLETSKEGGEKFIEKNNFTFPVLYDAMGEVDAIYKAQTIPTSIVVDPDGVIHHRIVGPISKERLEKIFIDLQNSWEDENKIS